ncbi:MAG TPA: hypothetical protein PLU50_06915 [Pseudobdellovibrionaceae bacterium]|nr:hypothetical protein [Pseudobdellovibrionaceae bacterium]
MTSEQVGEASKKAKRRGRPKGSKNKKKRGTRKRLGRPPGSMKKETTFKANHGSLEETIKQLLKLPTNAEAKVRLIEAALNI